MTALSPRSAAITGSLLGDGSLSRPRSERANAFFSKKQARRRLEYLEWLRDSVGPGHIAHSLQAAKVGGVKRFPVSEYRTPASAEFTALRREWYPEGVKRVPDSLVIDPLAVAVWFMDDGTNDAAGRCIQFSTVSFTAPERERLAVLLGGLGIQATAGSKSGEVTILSRSHDDFLDMVAPHCPWACFAYKLRRSGRPARRTASPEARAAIREMAAGGATLKEMAAASGFHLGTVSAVLRDGARGGLARNNTTGVRGLYWDKSRGKWAATARSGGRTRIIGRYDGRDDAIRAIEAARHVPLSEE